MPELIEIEGDLVRHVTRTVTGEVRLQDYLPKLERRVPVMSPVLPTGTRAEVWDTTNLNEQKFMVLIEQQPQIITLSYDQSRNGDPERADRYSLPIPWTRFFFYCVTSNPDENRYWTISDYRVMWSNQKYTSAVSEDMIPAMVPNVYVDGRICFGSTGASAEQTLAQRLDQTVNEFYISLFNPDILLRFPSNYHDWTTWAEERPNAWATWNDWHTENPKGHEKYSFNRLAGEFIDNTLLRNTPMMIPDGIPAVPLGASFGRIAEEVATWSEADRLRIAEALRQFDGNV